MPFELVILLLVVAIGGTWFMFKALNKAAGETAEQRAYANWCEPIFIEQQFFGNWWQARAVEEYDYVLARLEAHGNEYLKPYKNNVHLFIHRFDVNNPILDFEDWKIRVAADRQKIKEEFFLPKAARADQLGDRAAAARFYSKAGMMKDFVKDENGKY